MVEAKSLSVFSFGLFQAADGALIVVRDNERANLALTLEKLLPGGNELGMEPLSKLAVVIFVFATVVIFGRLIERTVECEQRLHHRNGDKTDNRIGNLAIMKSGEHSRQHGITRAKTQRRDADGRFGCAA